MLDSSISRRFLGAATDARHDLGKYVSFSVRFLDLDPPDDRLREALRDDLCRTRKRGDTTEGVGDVWRGIEAALRADLDAVASAAPDLRSLVTAIAERVAVLEADAAALDRLSGEELRATAGRAQALTLLTRDLHRSALRLAGVE